MSLTTAQIQEVFDWVVSHPNHFIGVISSCIDRDHPERVCHAIQAFPNNVIEYDLHQVMSELQETTGSPDACDYTFREGRSKTYTCDKKGTVIRGKVRCPFHSSLVFDLIDLADPVTLPRSRPMVPQDFADLREKVNRQEDGPRFVEVSPEDFLNDVKSRPRISVEEDDQSDQIVNEMNARLGSGIQFIQVTEEEVMDTFNERASAYRAEHVSADEVVEEMNARSGIQVIQVTADKIFRELASRCRVHAESEDEEPVGSVDSDDSETGTPVGSPSNHTSATRRSLAYPGTLESLCPTSDEE